MPAGLLIGFGAGKQFRLNVRTLRCETADWTYGDVRGGFIRDARRFLALVPGEMVQVDIETGAVQYFDAPPNIDRIFPIGTHECVCIRNRNEVWRLDLS